MRKVNNKGFSLVEILVAIAILGVLMTMAANAYNVYKKKARQQAYDTMAKSVTTAASNYLMENAKEKYISFETLKELDYIDTLQDPRYKENECSGIVINKVIQGQEQKKLDVLFQKVKLCCKNYKYQYDYTGDEVKITEIDDCNYIDGDEIDGVYKLIFKPSGGSECNPTIILKRQNEKWGKLCKTKRENFAFKGWNTKKNGRGTTITKDTKVGDRDISAYAIWNEIFKLEYDEDGGSKCDPSFKKKENGEKWGDLCVTEKEGYVFKGWRTNKDGEGTKITSNSLAERNLTVHAHWNPLNTITFDPQGGTECDPSSITTERGLEWGELCKTTREGYVFKGWNTKKDGTGTRVTSTTSAELNENNQEYTVYAIWNPKYTITYDPKGGSACKPKSKTVENGEKWGELCATTRYGYTFSGWYNAEEKITSQSTVSSSLQVEAHWNPKTCNLAYKENGGTGTCKPKSTEFGYAWGTLCEPKKTGYTFTGWEKDGKEFTQNTVCDNLETTISATWIINNYTLKYDDNNGTGCSNKSIIKQYNKTWESLCVPIRTGYTFKGWYDGSTKVTETSKATKDLTVKAAWDINTYTLSYDDNNGYNCSDKTIKKDYNREWGELCVPKRTGYTFTGWYDGTTQVTEKTKALKDLTVKASWNINTYILSYNDNGGYGCNGQTIEKKYNTAWGTLCEPKRTGYDFVEWKNGSTVVTSASKAKDNITINAQWNAREYTLYYDNNGGTGCSSKDRDYDSTWGTLCEPKKTGYKFNGWYDGSTKVTSSTKVVGDRYVKASWSAEKYELTYNDNNGTGCSSLSIEKDYNETWGTLCEPKRTGYTFAGWYNGSTKVTTSSKATADIEVKAAWTINKYTLTYNDNNGTGCSSLSIEKDYNQTWGTLCEPKRTGYNFDAWYSGSSKVTASSKATANTNVKANWNAKQYTLTFDNNGGSGCASQKGYYDSAWGTLCRPTKTGHTFDKWYDSNGTVSSSTTVKGDRNVKASWIVNSEEKTYTETFTEKNNSVEFSFYVSNPDTSMEITESAANGNISCSYSGSNIVCNVTNIKAKAVTNDDNCIALAEKYGLAGKEVKYYINNEHYDYEKWASNAPAGCYVRVDNSPKTSSNWTCMKDDAQNSFFIGSISHCPERYCGYSNCLTRGWGGSGSNKYCKCWIPIGDNYTTMYQTKVTVKYYVKK